MKRILLVTGIIIGLILIIAGGYYLAVRLISPAEDFEEQPDQLPPTAEKMLLDEQLSRVSDKELADYWFDEDGRLYLAEADGTIVNVSLQVLENLNKLTPSADGAKVLAEFGYPDNASFAFFNIANKSWTPLPSGTIAAAWHPADSDRLVYLQNSGLKTFNLKTKKTATVIRLNLVDVVLSWPEDDIVVISDRPSAFIENQIWTVNLRTKRLAPLSKGTGLIMSVGGGLWLRFAGQLDIIHPESDLVINFESLFTGNRPITLPDKCAINGFKVYCAVPKEISDDVALPDDYYKRKFISEDAFYIISVDTQKKSASAELFYDPAGRIDAVNLKISGGKLYFINRLDGGLYSLKI